jgi:hypothetical protein
MNGDIAIRGPQPDGEHRDGVALHGNDLMAARIVMIHGTAYGIGQSTLFDALRKYLPAADLLSEDEVTADGYPDYFERVEFAEVADRFRRHNANPSAGIGNPPARMLEDAYEAR